MSSKHHLWRVAAAVIIAFALSYWVVMLPRMLVPYRGFNEVKRIGGAGQVYGRVISDCRTDDAGCIEFTMVDSDGAVEVVRYCGVPPIGLERGKHVVAVGKFDGEVFVANQLLTKCPSRYSNKGSH